MIRGVLEWLESTSLARLVAESVNVTATLSATHLIGFVILTGSALVTDLRAVGAWLAERPAAEIARPTSRALAVGLAVSVVTGALLFAARAASVGPNGLFQTKIVLLGVAAAWHVAVLRSSAARPERLRALGYVGLVLLFALALAACAFILLE
jgi:hypothetical protein